MWVHYTKKMRKEAIEEWNQWDDQQREIAMAKIPGWQQSIPFIAVAAACEEMDYDVVFPAMPVTSKPKDIKKAHRERIHQESAFNVMVARPVTKQEMESTQKGRDAIAKEWGGHRDKKTWDESTVREWEDVKAETKAKNVKAGKEVVKTHVASLMEVDVEKNSELPDEDPRKKMKCRVVYRGDATKDEMGMAAIFNELGSAPATMEATKAADTYGLFEGHTTQTSDAEMAYTQAKLATTLKQADGSIVALETWVRLPKARWPPQWHGKFKDPVVRLVLALYGHPDAGGCWEQHCNKAMTELGWIPIPEWQSSFFHPKLKLMVTIYVDDLKMSGPTQNMDEGWKLIKSRIQIEPPTSASGTKFLGAMHTSYERTIEDGVTRSLDWRRTKPQPAETLCLRRDQRSRSE